MCVKISSDSNTGGGGGAVNKNFHRYLKWKLPKFDWFIIYYLLLTWGCLPKYGRTYYHLAINEMKTLKRLDLYLAHSYGNNSVLLACPVQVKINGKKAITSSSHFPWRAGWCLLFTCIVPTIVWNWCTQNFLVISTRSLGKWIFARQFFFFIDYLRIWDFLLNWTNGQNIFCSSSWK